MTGRAEVRERTLPEMETGMFKELKISVPWGHIAIKAWGSSQGQPVLCLHGWLDNVNTFDRLIPLLPPGFHYVAMDFRGHGLSSHRAPGVLYHFEDFVSDVLRVVTSLKWNRFSLITHSFGGIVGGMFSCMFPDMVYKLILLDSLPFILETKEIENLLSYKRKMIEHMMQVETTPFRPPTVLRLPDMLERSRKVNPQVGEDGEKILLQRGAREEAGGLVLNRDRRLKQMESCIEFISQARFLSFIKKTQARILLIKSTRGFFNLRREDDQDGKLVESTVDLLKSALKERFKFVTVTGNHYIHLNAPQVVAGMIGSFLESGPKLGARL
ncbi:serine hydrolase-like protein 2 [Tachyglossus aculeatus]|uniref:serine hydrolase-like protein 2 n=1 Tax=Tachyglossus aculeatus TaxID=9261 RepID=UPI0018F79809|nr:serine hydrolase-like protein 2 [Tachyglossus aculeatus]